MIWWRTWQSYTSAGIDEIDVRPVMLNGIGPLMDKGGGFLLYDLPQD